MPNRAHLYKSSIQNLRIYCITATIMLRTKKRCSRALMLNICDNNMSSSPQPEQKSLFEFSQLSTAFSDQVTPCWPLTKTCKQFLFTVISLCSTGVGHLALPKLKLALTNLSSCHNVGPHMAPCLSLTVRSCLWAHWRFGFQGAEDKIDQWDHEIKAK